ncbi:hypothetical protein ACLB1G_22325 [Oxalobacteraceae bacterium A2-2]
MESGRLRTFLSTEYVQNLELAHMDQEGRDGLGGAPLCIKNACLFFVQIKFFILIQWLATPLPPLRTILSTQNVQNCGLALDSLCVSLAPRGKVVF